MYDYDLPDDFYRNEILEVEYNRRRKEYMDLHAELFPSMHKGRGRETILSQITEMVRAELELERYDRQIGNDFDSNAWVDRTRKSVRDALFRYRSDLLLTPKQIHRVIGVKKEAKSFLEALQGIPNSDYVP